MLSLLLVVSYNGSSLTIVSVCVRPTGHFDLKYLYAPRQRFFGSLIVCSDFNTHHPSRDSTRTNSSGSALAEAVGVTDLILMNNGRPTYFSHQGAPSRLDLAFASQVVECYRVVPRC